jgi:hypothetical protein
MYLRLFSLGILIMFLDCNKAKKDKEPTQIYLYHRHSNSREYRTYEDYLMITNYENKTITADDLYKIAQKYIDSVKKNINVSRITFLIPNSEVESKHWDSEIWGALKKYCIFGFGFTNDFERNIGYPIKLNDITIWNNGNSRLLLIDKDSIMIDSILNSRMPLDN